MKIQATSTWFKDTPSFTRIWQRAKACKGPLQTRRYLQDPQLVTLIPILVSQRMLGISNTRKVKFNTESQTLSRQLHAVSDLPTWADGPMAVFGPLICFSYDKPRSQVSAFWTVTSLPFKTASWRLELLRGQKTLKLTQNKSPTKLWPQDPLQNVSPPQKRAGSDACRSPHGLEGWKLGRPLGCVETGRKTYPSLVLMVMKSHTATPPRTKYIQYVCVYSIYIRINKHLRYPVKSRWNFVHFHFTTSPIPSLPPLLPSHTDHVVSASASESWRWRRYRP